jgi:acyl-[acyl carrier protein]--UDP-N-acetylglucosamine O-acyltransferase
MHRVTLHPQALVDPGAIVGARTRVWAFAHVCNGADKSIQQIVFAA